MQAFHTAGLPPSSGRIIFPTIGWTMNKSDALTNSVTANSSGTGAAPGAERGGAGARGRLFGGLYRRRGRSGSSEALEVGQTLRRLRRCTGAQRRKRRHNGESVADAGREVVVVGGRFGLGGRLRGRRLRRGLGRLPPRRAAAAAGRLRRGRRRRR